MKRKYLTILLSFIFATCYSQQFSFIELTNMVDSQQLFETKNIEVGNSILKTDESEDYYFYFKNGRLGHSYDYPKGEIDEIRGITKNIYGSTDFAEKYDKETALTWYYFKRRKKKQIVGENLGLGESSSKIRILFYSPSAYLETVKQVKKSAEYIGIKEKWGEYFGEYEYNGLIIRLKKSNGSQKPSIIEFIKGNEYL
ncbi:MAG: hypothetical protein P8I43_03380 [Bacteroidia bacterium]|nr:hypothetical protein [Bacteroidia bacterium]